MPEVHSIQSDALACYQAIARSELTGKAWLVTEDRTVTFGELKSRIEAMAGFLARSGIGTGQRVVISSRNDAECALLFVALICNGVTVVNLDADTGPERAISLITKADPVLIILDPELRQQWSLDNSSWRIIELLAAAPVKLLGKLFGKQQTIGGLAALLAQGAPQIPNAHVPADTLAYILFTSGTTSQPKGVSISHKALFAHLATLHRRLNYSTDSRILNTLMLSHADGMIQGPVMGFYNQCTVFRPLRFEVTRIEPLLDAIFQLRISHMVAVPTMLAILLRLGAEQRDAFQGGDFQLLISCGAQLDKALWEDFSALFKAPLVNIYGLTETVVGGVFAGPDAITTIPGSIGRPEDCTLRIVDQTGSDVPAGHSGELLIQGDLLMSGYFADQELTETVLQNGWLRTGDIARCDPEGRYWIVGRSKNIIIRGGYNIHPEEISEVLERHPGVREAVTFGLIDPIWGETVAALAVADVGLTAEMLTAYCAEHMESRKVPSHLRIVAALPRGRSGKVVLDEARALFALPDADSSVATDDIGQRILRVAAMCFKTTPDQLALHMAPEDVLGWDSLGHMEFVTALESEFGISLSAREIMSLDRMDKALALITRS